MITMYAREPLYLLVICMTCFMIIIYYILYYIITILFNAQKYNLGICSVEE